MIIHHISNLISRLNKGESNFFILFNNSYKFLLEDLANKGFISINYNYYTKNIEITKNNIKSICVKSKPSRKIFVDKKPYKLCLGNFVTREVNYPTVQKFELLVYVV
jgi:hypothetical protein